jgi:uncharacterized membrane protein YgdD (TMEM256/DUF423 family)
MDRIRISRAAGLALLLAGLLGAWGVAAAAYGAHAGGDARAAGLIDTASRLLLVHAAALAAVAALSARAAGPALALAALGIGVGAGVFAGALHATALDGPRWLSAAAPWGGMGMIAGWLALAAAGLVSAVRGRG